MSKGFIHHSFSPVAVPVLFAKNPDGGLWVCIDYWYINRKMIKNQDPLPLLQEKLNLLWKAWIYTMLDVEGATDLRRVKEGEESNLASWTGYCLFEPRVVLFGTNNAPTCSQRYIINAIREALDDFTSAYLDEILIYSDSEEAHEEYVKWVMKQLLEAGLYLKPEKCEFHMETVRYLRLNISTKGISMDEDKVETVWNWSCEKKTKNGRLSNLFEVLQFLGCCNYYRCFIHEYSEKAELLTGLRKKDERFVWEAEQQLAFEWIVEAFTIALVLWHLDHEREEIIETDDSD